MQVQWSEAGLFLCVFPARNHNRLNMICDYMSDSDEFLSVGGIRALSKVNPPPSRSRIVVERSELRDDMKRHFLFSFTKRNRLL